jgi:hypothetical protein
MNAPRCRADQGPHHKGCTCEDWKQNIDLISGPIKLQAARTGGRGYEGKFVSHCPWCGARSKEGRTLSETDQRFLDAAFRAHAEEYATLGPLVFEATKPFGA